MAQGFGHGLLAMAYSPQTQSDHGIYTRKIFHGEMLADIFIVRVVGCYGISAMWKRGDNARMLPPAGFHRCIFTLNLSGQFLRF